MFKNPAIWLSIFSIILHACKTEDPDVPGGPNITPNPPPVVNTSLPAFPGAQGFGAFSIGGRGGRVIEVTNLNDGGPGSFRSAVSTNEPRVIVFRVGGYIDLASTIDVANPFITIAGHTAPGDGVTFRGAGIAIKTHHVIMRGIRVRVGDENIGDWDGVAVVSPESYDVIIDHCSFSWAVDENMSINIGPRNITYQYCISAQGLRNSVHTKNEPHSMGMLIGSNDVGFVSVHHNLFAHNWNRNPKVGPTTRDLEIVNNIIYNWELKATVVDPFTRVNIIGNHYIAGPNWGPDFASEILTEMSTLFVQDNLGPNRMNNTDDQWNVVSGSTTRSDTYLGERSNLIIDPAENVMDIVLNQAGAFPRDAFDEKIISDVLNGTGKIIDSQTEEGGWPPLVSGPAPLDSDRDGMPDSWETDRGLDPNDRRDSFSDRDDDGYTNVEEYLNELMDSFLE